MDNSTIITVGGKNRAFSSVNKLGIVLQGGGESLWTVPLEADSIAGRDVNDGHYYEVYKNSSGQIASSRLPDRISVVTPPNKTVYNNGETIDCTGMVVKAYTLEGDVCTSPKYPDGIIPFGELELSATVANIDATGDDRVYTNEEGIYAAGFRTSELHGSYYWYPPAVEITGSQVGNGHLASANAAQIVYITTYDGYYYGYTLNNNCIILYDGPIGGYNPFYRGTIGSQTLFYPVYHESWLQSFKAQIPPSLNNPYETSFADAVLYSGTQTITINWQRPDGEILETSFDITVMAQ